MRRRISNWLLVLLGALIYSVGLNAFLVANHLVEGGFVGISVLLLYKMHWPLGLTFLLLNIPVLIPGWKFFGREFIFKTSVGVAAVSLFSSLTAKWQVPTHDPLLGALYAGVCTGLGLGMIFRTGATTGGADIIARLIRHFYGLSMGKVLFSIDVVVLSASVLVVGHETAMYSLVALFVSSRVIDFVIEGVKSGKAITIISDKHEQIADFIHSRLNRGTTLLSARGGYTGIGKQVIYCVVPREEVTRVQQIVQEADPYAFVVVNDVHEVVGEGFTYDSPPAADSRS
ncbi:YitT family protein [Alicyclobacillus tolerans]|uniref:YitT family protein n=1 Tax=Alicyclobacillus tolerans TaxID=90970 RepID=UPI001F409542|nr:YitT family protein [Alicyclobacillus tolerans]MCF8563775.1 YitT family protein [Alicyclobacillus tolerans]